MKRGGALVTPSDLASGRVVICPTERCLYPITRQALVDGVVHQFSVVAHVHFLQQASSVGAHGFDAEIHIDGDFGDSSAGSDGQKHLKLTIG